MSELAPAILLPSYPGDLRQLVAQSFAEPRPVPPAPLPGGPLYRRTLGPEASSKADLVYCRGLSNEFGEGTLEVPAEPYWELALPHRAFAIGTLLQIAGLEVGIESLLAIERRVLNTYRSTYAGVPLPAELLRLLSGSSDTTHAIPIAAWLDELRRDLTETSSLDDLKSLRRRRRVAALVLGAQREWTDRQAAVVELIIDVIVLCRAVFLDIEAAAEAAARFEGSVALSLRSLETEGALHFERLLPALTRTLVPCREFPESEFGRVQRFLSARFDYGRTGLLHPPARSSTPPDPAGTRAATAPAKAANSPQRSKTVESSARETYTRVLAELNSTILSRPELCSELALIATAHVHGVPGQRVLLVGPSGVGKTFAGEAIAKALDQRFMMVSIPDTTATGWLGVGVIDVVETLLDFSDTHHDAVLLLDELDKAAVEKHSSGNSAAASKNLQSSLLGIANRQPLTTESGRQIRTDQLLLLATASFGDQFSERVPTTHEIVTAGFSHEFASRWEQRILISPPNQAQAVALLRFSDRAVGKQLGPLLKALEVELVVPDAVLHYAACRWLDSGSNVRSAAEWLVAAARRKLINVLECEAEPRIVLSADDLEIARDSIGRPEDRDDPGDWRQEVRASR